MMQRRFTEDIKYRK